MRPHGVVGLRQRNPVPLVCQLIEAAVELESWDRTTPEPGDRGDDGAVAGNQFDITRDSSWVGLGDRPVAERRLLG